jgi:NAD(P)-dependent dehydrogenase (short-subunit alcohol dehydrogenase family)
VSYPPATLHDLDETVELVEGAGKRILARVADVRDLVAIQKLCADGAAEFGGIDIVVANAGICNWNRFWEMSEEQWQTLIDINLTGVWKTLKAAAPVMIDGARGGSIIIVSSVAGIKALPAQAHYTASKHGLVGLTKAAAIELGPYRIRVNSIHPWGVDTPMGHDDTIQELFARYPTYAASFGSIMPELGLATPGDISNAVLWLAGDDSRMITGAQVPLDMGATRV